jgi:hypothetical protein
MQRDLAAAKAKSKDAEIAKLRKALEDTRRELAAVRSNDEQYQLFASPTPQQPHVDLMRSTPQHPTPQQQYVDIMRSHPTPQQQYMELLKRPPTVTARKAIPTE